jgi:hypothetical protein
MSSPAKGRALFHTRDSGGKAEMTPGQYVKWAQGKSAELDLSFDGTSERIEAMIREERSVDGDLFLDYDVKGNQLSRKGLNALINEALRDPTITHVLIPRRDRLARPDDPIDGIKLENALRCAGKTIVYMDYTLAPLKKGGKADIAELITALVDYDRAEKDRRDLAQKILYAQLRLAKLGFSTGGRPPYGFRRWLCKEDGTVVRELTDGERVRMAGHHTLWLPTAEAELTIIRRILMMLETRPATQVAAQLTREGIPSPDAGRTRKDLGIKHLVSGIWHSPTVTSIARNPLLQAVTEYGLRSLGDKLRFTAAGPRTLEDRDFRKDEKPKVICNPKSERITAPARFAPLVDVERHQKLLATLDARGGTQRGKPRSHDPTQNPLGGRIFDLNCTWPMYRVPYLKTFRYTCGRYQQSHGAQCDHNHVDGPLAARFMLSCLQQRMLSPTLLPKMEQRFRQLADQEEDGQERQRELAEAKAELGQVHARLKIVSGNMALAGTREQFDAISAVFNELTAREAALTAKVAEHESTSRQRGDRETEIALARQVVRQLTDLMADARRMSLAGEVFRLTNARLFLRFQSVQVKKRILNRVAGGVAVFGAAPDPIEIYRGPTGRRALKDNSSAASLAAEPGKLALPSPPETTVGSGLEGKSLGNVSRGDSLCTIVNETTGLWLVRGLFPQVLPFEGDAVLRLVKQGLYRKRR